MPIKQETIGLMLGEIDELLKCIRDMKQKAGFALMEKDISNKNAWIMDVADMIIPNYVECAVQRHHYDKTFRINDNKKMAMRRSRYIRQRKAEGFDDTEPAKGSLEGIRRAWERRKLTARVVKGMEELERIEAQTAVTQPAPAPEAVAPASIEPAPAVPAPIIAGPDYDPYPELAHLKGKRTSTLRRVTSEEAEAIKEGAILEYDDSVISDDDLAAMNQGPSIGKL